MSGSGTGTRADFAVATYNIRHGAPPGRSYRRRELLNSVRDLDVDLLALQEVDLHAGRTRFANQARVIAGATGMSAHFARARPEGRFGQYGVALLTRFPVLAQRVVSLPAQGFERRVALLATVVSPVGEVLVCATHLQHHQSNAEVQLEYVLRLLGRFDGPQLLVGDLNLGPEVVEPQLDLHGFGWAAGEPTFPTRAARRRIDWIAAKGLSFSHTTVPRVWGSDHFPLRSDVRKA